MFVFWDFKIDSHCVQISCLFFLDFEIDSHCVTPTGFKFSIILPQFTEWWDYRSLLPCTLVKESQAVQAQRRCWSGDGF